MAGMFSKDKNVVVHHSLALQLHISNVLNLIFSSCILVTF
jgi:hypothetical protein